MPLFITLLKLVEINYKKVFIIFCSLCWNMALLSSFDVSKLFMILLINAFKINQVKEEIIGGVNVFPY